MTSGVNHQGEESKYVYNALNILTRRETTTHANGFTATDFVVDYTSFVPTNLMEYGSDGIVKRHIYGNDLERISTKLTNANNPNQTETFFIQNDRLGTPQFATDINGNRAGHTHLDEWGKPINKEMPTFAGKQVDILNMYTNHSYDDVLGIYYAQARFYDPNLRRFTSPDPHWTAYNRTANIHAILQAGNLYSYTMNNPLKYKDPTGLLPPPPIKTILDEIKARDASRKENLQKNSEFSRIGRVMSNVTQYMMRFDCEEADRIISVFVNDPAFLALERAHERLQQAHPQELLGLGRILTNAEADAMRRLIDIPSTPVILKGSEISPLDLKTGDVFTATVSHYCACVNCCGGVERIFMTADGTVVWNGMPEPYIVATNSFPMGSQLRINDTLYTVRDRGGPLMGSKEQIGRFDIFTTAGHQTALQKGLIHDSTIEVARIGR
jgi:RHS repeat-associated protein